MCSLKLTFESLFVKELTFPVGFCSGVLEVCNSPGADLGTEVPLLATTLLPRNLAFWEFSEANWMLCVEHIQRLAALGLERWLRILG